MVLNISKSEIAEKRCFRHPSPLSRPERRISSKLCRKRRKWRRLRKSIFSSRSIYQYTIHKRFLLLSVIASTLQLNLKKVHWVLPSATFWTICGHRCLPLFPPALPFIYSAHRAHHSHFSVFYARRFASNVSRGVYTAVCITSMSNTRYITAEFTPHRAASISPSAVLYHTALTCASSPHTRCLISQRARFSWRRSDCAGRQNVLFCAVLLHCALGGEGSHAPAQYHKSPPKIDPT